jgi:protein-disulfide isomerase
MKFIAFALVVSLVCLAAAPGTEKSKTMGSLAAPIRMDLYSDFTCPHCKMFHDQILPKLIADYITPGKAYLVFHEYTLTGPGHEYSREAANYAAAAARIGKYPQVSAALFASQDVWARNGKVWDTVSAVLTPAERTRIQSLVKDPTVQAEVQHDVESGNASRVDRTPTVVITAKGKQTPWSYWSDYGLFKSFLDDQLK